MRRRAVLLTVVACLTTVVPAMALPASPPSVAGSPDTEDLQRLRDQLAAAQGDVERLDAAMAAARGHLDDIESRLAGATADLVAVRAALADAEVTRDAAAAEAGAATEVLLAANANLATARSSFVRQEAELGHRVRSMWKYGAADPGNLMLEGLARSQSLHDATLTMRTVEDLVDTNRALVDVAVDATRIEARARTDLASAQQSARRAEAQAAAEHARVASLVAQQEQLVTSVEAERQARQAVLDALASDHAVAARLVEQLDAKVAELAARLAAAIVAANPDARFDGPAPAWARGLPAGGQAIAPAIVGAASLAGVDPRLFAALVWSESGFHPGAVSHAGAIGLAQLMPGTARGLGVDPHDPVQNLVGGAQYLRTQLERFGSADLALAAYNAGPGRVAAAGNRIPGITETQVYVLRVLERYDRLTRLG